MNLKKVKLVHETPAHFIMHDGQTHFHIAKKGLDKEIIGRIKGFAEGGAVEAAADSIKKAFAGDKKEEPKSEEQQREEEYERIRQQNRRNMGYAEGGEVEEEAAKLNTPEEYASLEGIRQYANGSDAPVGEENLSSFTPEYNMEELRKETNALPQETVPAEASGMPAKGSPTESILPPAQQVSMVEKPAVADTVPKEEPLMDEQGMALRMPKSTEEIQRLETASVLGTAKEEAAAAANMAKAQQDYVDVQTKKQALHEQKMNEIQGKLGEYRQAIESGKIDPNRYWNDASTGTKLSAALGMILGGPVSGLTGQSNPAIEYAKMLVNNDLKAQEMDQSNKVNLYKEALGEYRDVNAARTAAALQAQNILYSKIQQISQSSQSPVIKYKAGLLLGNLERSMLPLQADLAQKGLLYQLSNTGKPSNINTQMLKQEDRDRVVRVPGGVILAKNKESAGELDKALPTFNEVEGLVNKMMDLQDENGTAILPYGEAKKLSKQNRAEILAKMSQLELLNRLTHEEIKLFEQIVPASGDWFSEGSRAQMKEFMKNVKNKRNLMINQLAPDYSLEAPKINTVPPKIK